MKSSSVSALALAAAMGGLGRSLSLLTINYRPLSQRPRYNQRKARKARRARHAHGDRKAFL